jgi:hypothetical protein
MWRIVWPKIRLSGLDLQMPLARLAIVAIYRDPFCDSTSAPLTGASEICQAKS